MKPPYATYALIAINLTVFLALALHLRSLTMDTPRDQLAILHWGANVNPLTLGGQPWRIFTSMFLHFGIWHLAVNMLALFSMGPNLESGVGSIRFVLIYLVSGVVANLFSLMLNVYVNSAGASGALFGIYGYSMGAFLISNLSDMSARRRVIISFIFFVVVNGLIAFIVNVDVWAHVGGFVAGFILALAQLRFRKLVDNRWLAVALVVLFLLMFVLPEDQVRYYRLYQSVLARERATQAFSGSEISEAEMIDSLAYALTEWDSIRMSARNLGTVRAALHHDTAVIRAYIDLSRKATQYNLLLRQRESFVYLDSIEITNEGYRSVPSPQYILNYYPQEDSEPLKTPRNESSSELIPRRVFFDANWREISDSSAAVYYRLGQIDSAERWQGNVRDYYRNGDIQMKGRYVDNLKDGIFLYYSDHKTYTSAGRYNREESVGKWETFHWNGAIHMETFHSSKTFVATVLDSLGRVQVQNGNGTVTYWHPNRSIAETGQYSFGRRTGDWLGYHADGTPYYRERYHDNKLVQGASVDLSGKRYVYDELSLYAYPVKGMDHFNQYVKENIRRPESRARGTRVRVLFQVGKDGDMWDFVILEGQSPEYEQEAIRLIREGPAWRSGLLHGHIPVPSQGYAVIVF